MEKNKDHKIRHAIAQALIEYRTIHHLRQGQMAIKLRISRSQYANYESARRTPPIEILKGISTVINQPLDQLLLNLQT